MPEVITFQQALERAYCLRLLDRGKLKQAFVSLHGDPNSEGNGRIEERTELMSIRRSAKNPLTVEFFDANSAHPWG